MTGMLVLPFPALDPVAIEVGPIAIRWYGLAYMAGLLLGWLYIRQILQTQRLWPAGNPPISADAMDDLLVLMTLGIVLGGRLGFVFLYEPSYFLQYPEQVFSIWQGGMAFHGGLLGAGLVILIYSRLKKVSVWTLMDLCSAAVPFGLFFGRMANFINGEIWGKVTNVPWAMVFPDPEAGPLPRHPTQLYEAFLEGIVLFIILRILSHHRGAFARPGLLTGVFLAWYGIARIIAEVYKEIDPLQPVDAATGGLITMGMVYSMPMVILGALFIWRARRGEALAPGRPA